MSMKFIILFLSIVITGVSQTPEERMITQLHELMHSSLRWSAISRNDFTPVEKAMIGRLINDPTNAFCNDYRIDGDYLDDFHLLDLDGDKDLDVIYEGFECVGIPTKTVIIYLNRNGIYRKVMNTPGRLASLKHGAELILYQYPCCSSINNTMIHYSLKADSLVRDAGLHFFYSSILSPLSKDYGLMLPKKIKTGDHYTIKVSSGVYYVPKEQLEKPVFIKESLAGRVKEETPATAYASARDKDNTLWLYCLIPQGAATLNDATSEFPLMIWLRSSDCIRETH